MKRCSRLAVRLSSSYAQSERATVLKLGPRHCIGHPTANRLTSYRSVRSVCQLRRTRDGVRGDSVDRGDRGVFR